MKHSCGRWTTGALLFAGIALSGMADASEEPLPPLGTPLAEIVDDLTWRTARGEPAAACRLAMELAVCAMDFPVTRSHIVCGLPPPNEGEDDRRERLERSARFSRFEDEREAQLDAHCAGAPVVSPEVLLATLRRAALLGSVEAMRLYVGARGWLGQDALEGKEGEAWKAHALPLSWALLHAGDLTIAEALWWEYLEMDRRGATMDGLPQEDLVTAGALLHYAIAVRKAAIPEPHPREEERLWNSERWVEMFDEELTPEEQGRVDVLVAEWLAAFEALPEWGAESEQHWLLAPPVSERRANRVAACELVIPAPVLQAP